MLTIIDEVNDIMKDHSTIEELFKRDYNEIFTIMTYYYVMMYK